MADMTDVAQTMRIAAGHLVTRGEDIISGALIALANLADTNPTEPKTRADIRNGVAIARAVIRNAAKESRPMELKLETKDQRNETANIGPVMMAPLVDEDYWQFRVKLSDTQAIVGFPKFGTIGVGFAVEEDWNTNLPYSSGVEEIFAHISHNKGDDSISDDDVRTALGMVIAAAVEHRES